MTNAKEKDAKDLLEPIFTEYGYAVDDPVSKMDICLVFEDVYDRDITIQEFNDLQDFILSNDSDMVNYLKDQIKKWEASNKDE
jgi:hypothetical protein